MARLRELARAREVVVDLFAGPNDYGSTVESVQRYFDAYALAVLREASHVRRPGRRGRLGESEVHMVFTCGIDPAVVHWVGHGQF